jgi:RNA polymerase sigma-70 factor, ECF subfamily
VDFLLWEQNRMSAEPDATDAALIERVRLNDLEALGEIFDRHYAAVYRTAAFITGESAAADDIAQECFLRVHRYAGRIDTNLPLGPWLYRVTVNLSYTYITRQRRRKIPLGDVIDRLMSPAAQWPDHAAEHHEMENELQQAIRDLGVNQRAVVVMHYLNGLSLEEIADALDCPIGTIKSRLHYARENLRKSLQSTIWPYEVAHGYST